MSLAPNATTATPLSSQDRERLSGLFEMLTYARPHDSKGEKAFVRRFIDQQLDGIATVTSDDFGNRWVDVGQPNGVMFSCHVDTVDANDERKSVRLLDDGRTIGLRKKKPGRCLGADDTAGLWLMLEMIKAGVRGTYVFHRGEEKGRLGSEYVRQHHMSYLADFSYCIAFDRRGHHDIITHQMGERCASDDFAASLGDALLEASGDKLVYVGDDGGAYTDSYSYIDVIPECTNLSVGYANEHGPKETLDAAHVLMLRDALVRLDWSRLVCKRDPADVEDWFGGYGYSRKGNSTVYASSSNDPLLDLVKDYPEVAADMLHALGVTSLEFLEEVSITFPNSAWRSLV